MAGAGIPHRFISDEQTRRNPQSNLSEEVASVLAEAFRLKSADVKLKRALQPLLEETLQLCVQKNPRVVAEALFPIFGQAIRKAIGAELDAILEQMGEILEENFTARGVLWRWKSFRTGISYAEIVMSESRRYRVDQVFLVHRETGLLLQHAVSPLVETTGMEEAADGIGSMLAALQDFVRDSVSGSEAQNLETVRVGEVNVVLAYGPAAFLAGFVRGVPPKQLSHAFQDALDDIGQEYADALHTFSGVTSSFDSCRPQLESCLLGQGDLDQVRSSSRKARALVFAIPVLLVLALSAWWVHSTVIERRWTAFAQHLESEPGIILIRTEKRDSKFYIFGMRDPLARDPASLLPPDLPPNQIEFRWVPYHSIDRSSPAQDNPAK